LPDGTGGATRFVILAAPRTGSNMLCSLLNSHADILCHHELFNPSGIYYALGYRDGSLDLGSIEQRDRQPVEFLDRIWQHPLGFSSVGFKMTRGQDERVLQAVLEDRRVRKILLRRSNVVRTYVSELIANQTGRWEVYDQAELPAEPSRVRVDLHDLQRHLTLNNEFYARLEEVLGSTCQEYFSTCYEHLSLNGEHRQLLRFLEVSPNEINLTPRSVRQNPEPLSRLIANYHEVESVLSGKELAFLLESEEVHANGYKVPGDA
jgi:LPS sulfotransferase NodH